jgi:hypothetical protein
MTLPFLNIIAMISPLILGRLFVIRYSLLLFDY